MDPRSGGKKNFLTQCACRYPIFGALPDHIVEKIIEKIKEKKKVSETVAIVLIAGLMQNGGTNKNAGQTTQFSVGDFSLAAQDLQNILKAIDPKATSRQLARSLAPQIAEVALNLGLEGDLANQMKYDHPDLTLEEAVWCSNFQTTNQECPERVRNWLVNNYKNRFNR